MIQPEGIGLGLRLRLKRDKFMARDKRIRHFGEAPLAMWGPPGSQWCVGIVRGANAQLALVVSSKGVDRGRGG